jgi:hypothetical protein
MDPQKKPVSSWIKAFIIVAVIFLITISCIDDFIDDMGLFKIGTNDIRTMTANAKHTKWSITFTADARYKTNTADVKRETLTAEAPKPPVITGINFPSEIPGNKSTITGLLYFTDPDGDIHKITYDVVSATNFSGGVDNNPKLDSGNWDGGAIKIYTWCDGQQDVTLEATLYDLAGNKSNPWRFSFTCK